MDWLQVVTLFLANAVLFFWARTESRSDWRKSDEEMKALRKDFNDEMKDFHSRLLILEERYLRIKEK